jgi:hypothetical protein
MRRSEAMHIDNTYLTNRTVGQPDQPAAPTDATTRSPAGTPLSPAASAHVPSPELLDLLVRVQRAPQVRSDVLARVTQRLANGYYKTRAAATKTADALQDAQD